MPQIGADEFMTNPNENRNGSDGQFLVVPIISGLLLILVVAVLGGLAIGADWS
jgi:hypothetical protein